MTVDPTITDAPSALDRAKNILLKPTSEWDRIAGEAADVNKLYVGYVLPLAVIAALAAFIGMSVFGVSGFGFSYHVPIVTGAVTAVLQVVMGLVGVFVLALITNALAPSFGSQQNLGQAHKLAAYGSTAGFLAGIFSVFPPIAMLGILGLYSLALIYLGLPRLMKTPEDKRIGYFVTIIVVAIVVGVVMGAILGSVRMMTGGGIAPGQVFGDNARAPQQSAGQVTLPGGGTVDLGEVQRQAQAQAQGGGAAIDPALLQAQLPQTLPGGFERTSISSGSAMGAAQAEAVYQSGNARLTVTIIHMGAMGAVAGMAAGMNVQENRQDADGYARTQTVDGRVYTEEVHNNAGSVSYGVVGHGVAVTVEGSGGVTIDQARGVVQAINVQRLEQTFGGG